MTPTKYRTCAIAWIAMLGWSCIEEPDAEPEACELGEPIIAGTPATNGLADSPAQCGQPAYSWRRSSELGQILETRNYTEISAEVLELVAVLAEIQLPYSLEHDVATQQVRYQTQDRGELVDATMLVAYPVDLPPGSTIDTLLFLHGTAGFADSCAPTNDTESGAFMGVFAAMGHIVAAPDFIGLKAFGAPSRALHPYLVGEATAIASLDAVRAAGRLVAAATRPDTGEPLDLCVHSDVGVVGGSQGGHAVLWVDRLQPYYARELNLVGGVATVPPANLIGQMTRALIELVPGSENVASFFGTAANWYGYEERLDEVFAPGIAEVALEALWEGCEGEGELDPGDYGELADVFASGLLDAAANDRLVSYDPWGCMVASSSLVHTDIPRINETSTSYSILCVLGENDELVHTPTERTSFEQLCEHGMPLQYLECAGAEHVPTSIWAMPEILEFIDDRFAGVDADPAKACITEAPVVCEGTP